MENDAEDMVSDWNEVAESYDVMGLQENLLRGIYAYGVRVASLPHRIPMCPELSDS